MQLYVFDAVDAVMVSPRMWLWLSWLSHIDDAVDAVMLSPRMWCWLFLAISHWWTYCCPLVAGVGRHCQQHSRQLSHGLIAAATVAGPCAGGLSWGVCLSFVLGGKLQ
jgi:hypothetical protein